MPPKIGAHVSTAGGLYKAFENARVIGADAIQIFGSSPQQWSVRLPKEEDIKKFKDAHKASDNIPVFLHASYLANLASASEITRANALQSLTGHLKIAELIGAEGLIFHIGSGKDQSKEDAMNFVIEGCLKILKNVPGKSLLILENSSAGGAKLGATAEEVGAILKKIKSPRAKVCFDTAHAFEAGVIEYDSTEKIKKVFDEWDKAVGLENIVAIHANDSKTAFGSHNDRHENLGVGHIGLKGFQNLAQEKRLWNKVWLLEVPGFDNLGPDKKNVDILRSCFIHKSMI
ncbi:MAG: deoxyribonuclease IV [Candidatus Liptonbacteria bacterium]|nr:deoxyribonuclease IV [Candidatus Liptonbacteria bacterium]